MSEKEKGSKPSIRLLLFSGAWENEGNFWALETEKSILLFAMGQNSSFLAAEVLEWSYLEKNHKKIKAIILNNINPKNCSLLAKIYQEINLQVPIYGSQTSKLILTYLIENNNSLEKKFISLEPNKTREIDDFSLLAWPLNSYIIGNLAIMINYQEYTFYYLEDFVFTNLSDNSLLFIPNSLNQIRSSLAHRRKTTFLLTSCQNLRWNNNNSLFLEVRRFTQKSKNYFFLLYDFDWLHICELLELAQKQGKKVKILEPSFQLLIKKTLANHPLNEVIFDNGKEENIIYLLVGSPENIEQRLINALEKEFAPHKAFNFVVGASSFNGGEGKTARLIDYLHNRNSEVINLSRSDSFSLGASFYDLKLLLDIIQPQTIITFQNSYKHYNYLNYLEKNNFLRLPNQSFLDITTKKIFPLQVKKEKIDTEKLLLLQRQNLFQFGLLVVLLVATWQNNTWQLKKLKIESLAVSSAVNFLKLEEKIKQWWEKKIVPTLSEKKELKDLKRNLEKRLTGLLSKHLSFEYDVELKEPILLLFLEK